MRWFVRMHRHLERAVVMLHGARMTRRVEEILQAMSREQGWFQIRVAVCLRYEENGEWTAILMARPRTNAKDALACRVQHLASQLAELYNERVHRQSARMPVIFQVVTLYNSRLQPGSTCDAAVARLVPPQHQERASDTQVCVRASVETIDSPG